MNEPNREDEHAREEVSRDQRASRLEAAALAWPALCAILTLSILILGQQDVLWRPARRLARSAWWVNAMVAVGGSVVGGVSAARDHQRFASAVAFGIWSILLHFAVLALGGFFLELAGVLRL